MGYRGCMGYEALFPANQLGGLKNVWNLREYGVCEPWVMRESTVACCAKFCPWTSHQPYSVLEVTSIRRQH